MMTMTPEQIEFPYGIADFEPIRRERMFYVDRFSSACDQLAHYRKALEARFGDVLVLRSYVVVAVDLERMLGEEI